MLYPFIYGWKLLILAVRIYFLDWLIGWLIDSSSAAAPVFITSSNDGSLVEDLSNLYTDSVKEEEPIKQSSSAKRKSEENQVPRSIDNKRKHLEKSCLQHRDQLLLQKAKDDAQFCKTLAMIL